MSGWGDLNSRLLRPERSALTGLRYIPSVKNDYWTFYVQHNYICNKNFLIFEELIIIVIRCNSFRYD